MVEEGMEMGADWRRGSRRDMRELVSCRGRCGLREWERAARLWCAACWCPWLLRLPISRARRDSRARSKEKPRSGFPRVERSSRGMSSRPSTPCWLPLPEAGPTFGTRAAPPTLPLLLLLLVFWLRDCTAMADVASSPSSTPSRAGLGLERTAVPRLDAEPDPTLCPWRLRLR